MAREPVSYTHLSLVFVHQGEDEGTGRGNGADGGASGMKGGFHSLSGGSRMAAEAVQQQGGRGTTDSNGELHDLSLIHI